MLVCVLISSLKQLDQLKPNFMWNHNGTGEEKNDDMHESSEEFEFRPDWTTDCGVSCPGTSEENPHRLITGKTISPIFLSCS